MSLKDYKTEGFKLPQPRTRLASSSDLDRVRRSTGRVDRTGTANPPPTRTGAHKRSDDIPPKVRAEVRERSGGWCELDHDGCTGKAVHMHHRQLRRPDNHYAANLLHVCHRAHHDAHHLTDRYDLGWMVHSWDDPARVPVLRLRVAS